MKKFLVIRFSSIGDIVLTSPVVRCLKEQVTDATVHYITKKAYASLVTTNPHVDKVYTIEKEIDEVAEALKKEKYDFVVDLHRNLRTFRLKQKLGRPSGTFPKLNIQKFMLTNFKWNSMPEIHIVDRYFEAVKKLNVQPDGKGLDYFIPDDVNITPGNLPVSHQNGYIGFAIGAQYEGKKLPPGKLSAICQGLDYPIVLLGGPEDAIVAEEIVKANGERTFNACGKFSLNQSAFLVQQADLIITHDTGLMHIASAFKKKIISLWGCTSPILGMSPYLPHPASVMIEPDHRSKRPCSKLGNKCSYGDFTCPTAIDNDVVIKTAEDLLKA